MAVEVTSPALQEGVSETVSYLLLDNRKDMLERGKPWALFKAFLEHCAGNLYCAESTSAPPWPICVRRAAPARVIAGLRFVMEARLCDALLEFFSGCARMK